MEIGVTLLVISILIASIWIVIEIKRLKHKLFAIFLIAMIILAYVSFTFALRGHDLDIKTISGVTKASKIYLSWLGSIFGNFRSITSYAIKQDWDVNSTEKPEE